MNKVFKVAFFSFKENRRNKNFYILLIFAFIIIISGFLFSKFAEEIEERMIRDVGLGGIEFFSFLAAIFLSAKLLLTEIENKVLYPILTKPIKRWQYFLGRYIGTVLVIGFGVLVMGIILTFLLFVKKCGSVIDRTYFLSYLYMFFKIVIIISLSFFFSLLSTSQLSSMIFTGFLWILGHLSNEIKYLAEEVNPLFLKFIKFIYIIFPNFSYFNLKDFPDSSFYTAPSFFWILSYSLTYSLIFLIFSILIFNNKDL